jgi:formylglycine-generating enzyme required for sulfatase activity
MRAQFSKRRLYCRGRAILSILAGLLALVAGPMAAMAEKRHAFVVGINTYDKLPAHYQLNKAVGDARAMGDALTSLGFAVTPLYDVKRGELVERWSQFLEQVGPGDSVAVVFSGHGIELEGANYLLPRDVPRVRTGRESQLRNESLSFGQMMTDLRERRPAFAFVVLDACRDNPFEEGGKTVGGKRGLGQVEPLEGTFVMFSAGAGQTALDRLGDSDTAATSVFTRTLVPLMRKPGLSLLEMADSVGEQVRDLAGTIGHRQTPAFYSRVIGGRRVCLAGCEVAAVVNPDQRPAPAGPSAVETVQVCREVEQVTSLRTLEALERRYAGTPIADCISARMGELKAAQSAALTKPAPTPAPAPEPTPARPAVSSAFKPGETFRDCPTCPEMVVIPAGSFMMGSSDYVAGLSNAGPMRTVTIAQPFAVGKFEVTVTEWETCVAGGGCESIKRSNSISTGTLRDEGKGRQPIIIHNWDQGHKYVTWLAKKTGQPYRLLTEAEWEYAARAGTRTPFHTGPSITTKQANFGGEYYGSRAKEGGQAMTTKVGSFRPNAFGLHDMHGNVSEFVADCYWQSYEDAPTDGSSMRDYPDCARVIRGGSWSSGLNAIESDTRDADKRLELPEDLGFRVARSVGK